MPQYRAESPAIANKIDSTAIITSPARIVHESRRTGFQPVSGEALIVTLRNAGNASTWGTFLTCRSSPTSTHRHVGNVPHIDEVTIRALWRRQARCLSYHVPYTTFPIYKTGNYPNLPDDFRYSITSSAKASADLIEPSNTNSGFSGASYGSSMPVNPLISPALAFL